MAETRGNYFQVKGTIFKRQPLNQVTEKFKKREFVLEIKNEFNGKMFTELVTFTAIQATTDVLEYFAEGHQVEVSFSLSGREWAPKDEPDKKKYFNTLTALHIQNIAAPVTATVQPQPGATQGAPMVSTPQFEEPVGDYDDLPF